MSTSVDNTIPTRAVQCFPNNKPWTTSSDLEELLHKRSALRDGVQRELEVRLRQSKEAYSTSKSCMRASSSKTTCGMCGQE